MSKHRAGPRHAAPAGAGRHRAPETSSPTLFTPPPGFAAPQALSRVGRHTQPQSLPQPHEQISADAPPGAEPRTREQTRQQTRQDARLQDRQQARAARVRRAPSTRFTVSGVAVGTLAVVTVVALSGDTDVVATTASAPDRTAGQASVDEAATRGSDRVSRSDRSPLAAAAKHSQVDRATTSAAGGMSADAVVKWASPVAAPRVSSCFGARGVENHRGADLPKPLGTPIYAIGAGTVIAAGPASGFGYRVLIQHDGGVTSTYGHMRYWNVTVGQQVAAGQQIAVVGNEGQSTGPHVHVEVREGETVVDPSGFLRKRGVDLGSD